MDVLPLGNRIVSAYLLENIMQEKLKVLIIDDHPLMRRGIKQLVELEENFEVVADVEAVQKAFPLRFKNRPI